MIPENFVYWLQGHCEMNPEQVPTKAQWEMIKDHLQLVFKKETAPLGKTLIPEDWLEKLQKPPVRITPYDIEKYRAPTVTC